MTLATSWCARQDLNLHARAMEPKSIVSANSTTGAYPASAARRTRRYFIIPQKPCQRSLGTVLLYSAIGFYLCLRILPRIVDMQQMERFLRGDLLIERIQDRVVLRRFDKRLAVSSALVAIFIPRPPPLPGSHPARPMPCPDSSSRGPRRRSS